MMLRDEIRRLAAAKGLNSHQAIAEACCVSRSFITSLLSADRKKVTVETLHMLSLGLDVTRDHWKQFFNPKQLAVSRIKATPDFPRSITPAAVRSLDKIGVRRMDDLVAHTESELLALVRVGKRAVRTLKAALHERGKMLKGDVAGEDEHAAVKHRKKKK